MNISDNISRQESHDTRSGDVSCIPGFRVRVMIAVSIGILAVIGYFGYSEAKLYSYMSSSHFADLMRAKFFSIIWLCISFGIIYWRRKSSEAPALVVLALSVYFVVLYGILFRGTEYGMNGHWGDNGNRLAQICKMMAYNTFFTDWYLKDLPSFYPPGWFALMVVYAKVLGIEAYQTIKFGYLFVFLVYPWLLYFSWKKLVSPAAAAAVTVATIFIGYRLLDWVYYEHMTASLFIPWWLYFFESIPAKGFSFRRDWKFYSIGGLLGGLMAMTYYYWFFMAAAAVPISLMARYLRSRSWSDVWRDIAHKSILMTVVSIVSAVYWLPLLRSIYWEGSESAQHVWFGLHHSDLTLLWDGITLESLLVVAGLFFTLYLWDRWGQRKLLYFFLGGIVLILVDRIMNLSDSSLQTRKIIEFAHVFAMAPLGIGVVEMWRRLEIPKNVGRGLIALVVVCLVVVANSHTLISDQKYYRIAVNQRVPANDLAVFEGVETDHKVFLTTHYRESCYLPYYLFIPYYNMTSHTAGRYSQRELFLDQASKLTDPELLAYALAHNRYSPIDYIYVPLDSITGHFNMKLYQERFRIMKHMKQVLFAADHRQRPDLFIPRHDRGLFELKASARSSALDSVLRVNHPDLYWHLHPVKRALSSS